MRVSVIINNFNYRRFLAESIGSALDQTIMDKEVIVVDDGSTDGSVDLIRSFGDRVRAVFKENGGQASAFNAGFAAATGDHILFLDADDRLYPDAVGTALSVFEDSGTLPVNVQFFLKVVDSELNPVFPSRTMPLFQPEEDPRHSLLTKGKYKFSPTSGNLYDRRLLERILPMPEPEYRVCADSYIQTCVPFYGQVVFLDEVLGDYRVHSSNNHSRIGREKKFHELTQSAFYRSERLKTLQRVASECGVDVPPNLAVRELSGVHKEWLVRRLGPEEPYCFDNVSVSGLIRGIVLEWLNGRTVPSGRKGLVILCRCLFVFLSPRRGVAKYFNRMYGRQSRVC